MRTVRSFILPALCLLGCFTTARAQFILTYQGFQGGDSDVGIYDPTTNELVATFIDAGVFKVLANSTGTNYYFISNAAAGTAGSPIDAIGTFNAVRHTAFGTFKTPVTSAVLTPNDQNLIVGESTLHIFGATQPFPDLVPGGIAIPNTINVTDVAVDYDSLTVYALSAGVTQSYLTSINLSTLAITQTVNAPAGSSFLTLGPNGLLYISSPNTITEINPLTLAPTTSGTVTVPLANPGRPVFTPAGQYLVTADQSPVAGGSAAALVDLNLHAVTGTVAYNGLNDPITQLNVLSDTQLYALVQGTTTLYQLLIGTNGGLILNTPPFAANLSAAVNPGSVTDVAAFNTSQDLGAPGRNAPQYVFVVGGISQYIYEIDPVSLAIVDQIAWSASNFSAPDGVSYPTPSNVPSATPTTVLLYGNNQTVPLGGQTLPIVVRVLDQNGNPVAGQLFNFQLTAPGGTDATIDGVLNPPPGPGYPPGVYTGVLTGASGYADIYMTAGTLSTDVGANSISATLGSLAPSAVVNVGTATPATAAALTVVSGQGQIVFQNPNPNPEMNIPLFASTPLPLTVLATDSSGNPLSGVPVIFQVVSSDPSASPGATQTVVTDSTGQAAATFPGISTTPFSPPFASNGFATETITATAGTLSTNFYLTSVLLASVTGVSCLTPPCLNNVPLLNIQVLAPAYGSLISGSANSTIPNAVKIVVTSVPSYAPIPNVGLNVNTGSLTTQTNARCSEPTGSGIILTDSTGTAVCNLLLNNVPGTLPLSIFVPQQLTTGVTGFANLTVTSNPAATINIISGNNQYLDEGVATTLLADTFAVQVVDATNTPVVSAPVTWQVVSGPLTLSSVQTMTDTNGMATAVPEPGMTAGLATVTVTAGGATATFTDSVAAPAGNIVVVSGNNQTVPVNAAAAAPLLVQVLDQNGNPAPFVGVAFSVSTKPAVLGTFSGTTPPGGSSITVTTDANGQASASFTAGIVSGAITVSVTSVDGLASTFFSLTAQSSSPSSIQVVNAGSLLTNLSPGTLVDITGANVASSITGTVTDPATLTASGYSVTVEGIPAPITGLMNVNGFQQVTAQIPFEVTAGSTSLTLQTPQGSGSANIAISTLSPAILTNGTVSVSGSTFPLALATRPDGSTVSATNPAQQGDVITFSATGLGQTTPTAVTGNAGVPDQIVYAPLFMAVNHLGATVTSAVYTAGAGGTYSIAVQIPSTAMIGPGQPISLYEVDSTGLGYNAPDVYLPIVSAP